MELNQIRYFVALSQYLNFTKAAEACGVSQPTLSRAIQILEQELGADLVRRERGRTHLTDLGLMILPSLERALQLTDTVKADALDFGALQSANLKLGVMCTIGPTRLIPVIKFLVEHVPQLEFELMDANGEEIINKLINGNIDIAMVGLPNYPELLSIQPLYDERYVVAFPAGHRFEKMVSVPVHELNNERYLLRLNCEYMEHFSRIQGATDFEPDIRYKSEHEDWIQAMIIAGIGCACMPEYMSIVAELQRRPLIEPAVTRTISIATVRGRRHSPAIDLLVKTCADHFRKPTGLQSRRHS